MEPGASANRYVFRGRELVLNEGFDVEIYPGRQYVTLLQAGRGGTAGRFRCRCSGQGSCRVAVSTKGPDTVLRCNADGCASCVIDLVLDPAVILA